MLNQFSRTQLVFGEEAMQRLAEARVAVFGIGGVGGYTVEALARSGIGQLDLIDDDKVCITNVNRQLLATLKTVGQYKVDVAKERIADINPKCRVNTFKTFYMPDTEDKFDFKQYDYIVDAIDTVKGKLALALIAQKAVTPIISSMGAGNKVDAAAFEVADIYRQSHALRVPQARYQKIKGRLLQGEADQTKGRYVNQLPQTLRLPSWNAQMYGAPRYTRFNGICTVGGRTDHSRRSD